MLNTSAKSSLHHWGEGSALELIIHWTQTSHVEQPKDERMEQL